MENKKDNLVNVSAMLLCLVGADIVAPEAIVESKLAQFEEIKDSDDQVIDSSCIVAKMESPTARTELIKLLTMRFLPLSEAMRLHNFLGDYVKEMIDYTCAHPECKQKNSAEEIEQKIRKIFG